MAESTTRSYRLTKELMRLFDLESQIDTVLSVSMYYLNQFMESERSSIFLFEHVNQRLVVFSSLDLNKREISIPKSCGVAGWVFVNRKPAIVQNAYEDSRFCREVDEMTGFRTQNLICAPMVDTRNNCIGTIQSLNRKTEQYTDDDLQLLNLAADMVGVAIKSSKLYDEILVVNEARKKFIERISGGIVDFSAKSKII